MDYKGDAAASEAELRHDWRLSGTIYPLECLESEGENQQSFIVQEVVRGLRKECSNMKRFNRLVEAFDLWLRSVEYTPESTDSRPCDLYQCGSRGMFLVSLLYERKCLRIDLIKINCCLNVPFIIWSLYVLNSVTSELQCGSCRVFIALAERKSYLL